mmetsp:Transcript_27035/g.66284  ORF Transcript_27035/g.66284 Transcript_27035/m.66284 type:complete len:271 (-) Transcript_27035:187-999(-)
MIGAIRPCLNYFQVSGAALKTSETIWSSSTTLMEAGSRCSESSCAMSSSAAAASAAAIIPAATPRTSPTITRVKPWYLSAPESRRCRTSASPYSRLPSPAWSSARRAILTALPNSAMSSSPLPSASHFSHSMSTCDSLSSSPSASSPSHISPRSMAPSPLASTPSAICCAQRRSSRSERTTATSRNSATSTYPLRSASTSVKISRTSASDTASMPSATSAALSSCSSTRPLPSASATSNAAAPHALPGTMSMPTASRASAGDSAVKRRRS